MSLFESVMRSPNVWTGKDGVTSVDKLLANPTLQDKIQENLIRDSYGKLVDTGSISIPSLSNTPLVGSVLNNNNLGSVGSSISGALKGVGSSTQSITGDATSQLGALAGNLGSTFNKMTSSLSNKIGQFKLQDIVAQGDLSSLSGFPSLNQTLSSLSSAASSIFKQPNSASFEGIGSNLTQALGSVSNLAGRGISQLGGLLTNASKVGVETATKWAKGLTPDTLTSDLNSLAKQGQFAVNFSDFKLPAIAAGTVPAAAFEGTVNRSTVDAAFVKLIGNNKIPTPDLGVPFPAPLNFDSLKGPMNNAASLLKGSGSALLGQSGALAGGIPGASLPGVSLTPGGTIDIPGLDTGSLAAGGTALESGFYGRTDSADLVYTGDDAMVWDRVNAERIKRGLPGLAAIGYPRP